jgi:hypothetical protein
MTRFTDAAAGGAQSTVTESRLIGATGALLGMAAAIAIGDPGLDLVRREACIGAEIAVIRFPRHLRARTGGALLAGAAWEVWAAFGRYPDDVH